jgi:hypothetical protein
MRLQTIGMRKAFFRRRVILRELRHFKFDKILQYLHAVRALLFPGGERRGKDVTVDRMQAQHQHRTVQEMVS